MSESFHERLSRFTPDAAGLDRDALLFAAGRASARPNRRWLALCGTLAATQLLMLGMLCWPAPLPPMPNSVPMIVESAPPAVALERPSLWPLPDQDFATENDPPRPDPMPDLVADEPPMHAFGTFPPALFN